jgi:hypothetical protein
VLWAQPAGLPVALPRGAAAAMVPVAPPVGAPCGAPSGAACCAARRCCIGIRRLALGCGPPAPALGGWGVGTPDNLLRACVAPAPTSRPQDAEPVAQAVRDSPLKLQARVEGNEVHVPVPRCAPRSGGPEAEV